MGDLLDTFPSAAEILTRYGIKGRLFVILGITLLLVAIIVQASMPG